MRPTGATFVAAVCLVTGIANAAAPSRSRVLVLRGEVTSIEPGGSSETKPWIVTVQVEKLVTGDFSGPAFQFAIHSPARSGLEKGRSYTIEAVWNGTEYEVDQLQWRQRARTSTSIAEAGLSFEAAGRWSKLPRDDPQVVVYRALGVGEEITLTVLPSKKQRDAQTRRETVAAFVEHRQTAERHEMRQVSFGQVNTVEREGLTVASYCGVDGITGTPFATVVLASKDKAWILFYEAPGGAAVSFCPKADGVFATIRKAKKP